VVGGRNGLAVRLRKEKQMPGPLIYVSTWRIKEGRLEDYRRFSRELMEHFEAKEPQIVAFNMFLNEDETEMTSIQVHPDAASMESHLRVLTDVLGEEMKEWVERADFLEPKHIEVYGTQSVGLVKADQSLVDTGIPYSVKPRHLGGFTRSTEG
jgi:hypothetical protein